MTYQPKWSVEQLEGKLKAGHAAVEKARKSRDKLMRRMEETGDYSDASVDRYTQADDRVHAAEEDLLQVELERSRMIEWYQTRKREAELKVMETRNAHAKAHEKASNLDQDYHRLLVS